MISAEEKIGKTFGKKFPLIPPINSSTASYKLGDFVIGKTVGIGTFGKVKGNVCNFFQKKFQKFSKNFIFFEKINEIFQKFHVFSKKLRNFKYI